MLPHTHQAWLPSALKNATRRRSLSCFTKIGWFRGGTFFFWASSENRAIGVVFLQLHGTFFLSTALCWVSHAVCGHFCLQAIMQFSVIPGQKRNKIATIVAYWVHGSLMVLTAIYSQQKLNRKCFQSLWVPTGTREEGCFTLAPCTLEATRRVTWTNGARPHSDACCVALLGVRNVNSAVAFVGFLHPSLLRFSRRVRCGWGLCEWLVSSLWHRYAWCDGSAWISYVQPESAEPRSTSGGTGEIRVPNGDQSACAQPCEFFCFQRFAAFLGVFTPFLPKIRATSGYFSGDCWILTRVREPGNFSSGFDWRFRFFSHRNVRLWCPVVCLPVHSEPGVESPKETQGGLQCPAGVSSS